MEDKETELLCKLAANHLFLAQFEPLRATLRSLRARNPELARSILQTIVAKGGRFDSVIWSQHSCPSPSLLTFLSTLELLQFNDPVSQLWSFDGNDLKLRAEFLLYVQIVSYRVLEGVKKSVEGNEEGFRNFDAPVEFLAKDEGFRGLDVELGDCLRVLDRISDVGLSRLRPDLIRVEDEGEKEVEGFPEGVGEIGEEEIMALKRVIIENADVFDVLCVNIEKQLGLIEKEDSRMAITLRTEGKRRDVEDRVLSLVQRCVQIVHLDAIGKFLEKSDLDGAISHLKYLHLDYGVEEKDYRMVLQGLLRKILTGEANYGDTWFAMRDKLLSIYGDALSSCCISLVQMIQVIQDELLCEEIETFKTSENHRIHFPYHRLQKYTEEMTSDMTSNDNSSWLNIATSACMRDIFHYARVCGLHVLECTMDAALTAVRAEQLPEASYVLSPFPRLQPLVAVMGWDLLSGKTTLRRKLMQLLWTSKSQVLRLEESPLYGNKSDEISCVEQLCDTLCYQLDLASFVACINSGQPWSLKLSLLLSGKDFRDHEDEHFQWDPFVENFVLERLSVQSPLRVRLRNVLSSWHNLAVQAMQCDLFARIMPILHCFECFAQ